MVQPEEGKDEGVRKLSIGELRQHTASEYSQAGVESKQLEASKADWQELLQKSKDVGGSKERQAELEGNINEAGSRIKELSAVRTHLAELIGEYNVLTERFGSEELKSPEEVGGLFLTHLQEQANTFALRGNKEGLDSLVTRLESNPYFPNAVKAFFSRTGENVQTLYATQKLAAQIRPIVDDQLDPMFGRVGGDVEAARQSIFATNTRLTRAVKYGIVAVAAAAILGLSGLGLGIYNAARWQPAQLVPIQSAKTPTPPPTATAALKPTPAATATHVPTPPLAAIVATATPTPKSTPTAVPTPTLVPPTSTPTPVPSPTSTPYATATPRPTAVPTATPQLERILYYGCTTKEQTPLRPQTPYYSFSPRQRVIDVTKDLLLRIKSVTGASEAQASKLDLTIAEAEKEGNELMVLFAPGVTKGCTDMGVFAKIRGRQEIVIGTYLKLPNSSDANILARAYGMSVPLESLTVSD